MIASKSLPVTVLIAARNESANMRKCLASCVAAQRVIVVDSASADGTADIAMAEGAEVVQFQYTGSYPKKRQWALNELTFDSDWILFLDADEVIPDELWEEIRLAIAAPCDYDAFLITKGFHFLGKKFRYGGFSHKAVLLVRKGKGRFEELVEVPGDTLDMEVHERIINSGPLGVLKTPLIHEDFKGLEAYIDRHNHYSTWEAYVRNNWLESGVYGETSIQAKLFGNDQQRRRWLKKFVVRMPLEPWIWFVFHYFWRLGFLEGRPGLVASQIRRQYIQNVRAKIYEFRHQNGKK